MSLSADDKLLGEKVHYYCSSSEDEGDDDDDDDQIESGDEAGDQQEAAPAIPEPERYKYDGHCTNVSDIKF